MLYECSMCNQVVRTASREKNWFVTWLRDEGGYITVKMRANGRGNRAEPICFDCLLKKVIKSRVADKIGEKVGLISFAQLERMPVTNLDEEIDRLFDISYLDDFVKSNSLPKYAPAIGQGNDDVADVATVTEEVAL